MPTWTRVGATRSPHWFLPALGARPDPDWLRASLKAQGFPPPTAAREGQTAVQTSLQALALWVSTPRLCVEVKSEDSPIGREPVDKLLGP